MSEPAIHIRRATPSDIGAIARIHVEAWQRAYRGQIPDDVLDSLDKRGRAAMWLKLLGDPGHVLNVAVHDGNVLGFCSLIRSRDAGSSDEMGEIAAIYVDPMHWRCGAGTALVRAALAAGRDSGYRAISLWVLASNLMGRSFYERLGFAPDGESKLETRGGYSLLEVRYRRDVGDAGSS